MIHREIRGQNLHPKAKVENGRKPHWKTKKQCLMGAALPYEGEYLFFFVKGSAAQPGAAVAAASRLLQGWETHNDDLLSCPYPRGQVWIEVKNYSVLFSGGKSSS